MVVASSADCHLAVIANRKDEVKTERKRQEFRVHLESASEGNAYAQSWIGHAFENGVGVKSDLAEAFRWHLKAAENGEAYSQCWLGWAYHYGEIVKGSFTKSFQWYRRAALGGYACGQYNLGNAYSEGCGVRRNPTLAVKWWQRAALQGDAYAQNNLGDAYEDGEGVKKNIRQARLYYAAAAKQGDVIARFNLARFKLADKNRAQREFKSLIPELRKAARNNDPNASLCLGDCAFFGWGMNVNKKLAAQWYGKAKENRCIPTKG